MISYEEAIKLILKNSENKIIVRKKIRDCTGLILAEDIYAKEDIPPFRNSAVDGYAVRSYDLKECNERNPKILKIIGKINPGEYFNSKIKEGEAVKVMTGSYVPEGADSVCMKEFTEEEENFVKIFKPTKPMENIREKGEEVKKNQLVVKSGEVITPPLAGLIAKVGYSRINVIKKPDVSLLVTGNELLAPGKKLKNGKIWDANSYSLISALEFDGFKCKYWCRVRDDPVEFKNKMTTALKISDIIIISGGMSVGETDYVKDVFKEIKVKEIFWKVNIKPGKPLYFGKKDEKLIFGLPGNPASSLVCYYEFVRPALFKLSGYENLFLKEVEATLLEKIEAKTGRLEFVRGNLIKKGNEFYVKKSGHQESHLLTSFANSNCLIIINEEKEVGEKVKVHLLPWYID